MDFSPNWVWFKNRSIGSSPSGPFSHSLYDTFRGTEKELKTDSNQEEQNNTDGLTNFDLHFVKSGDAKSNTNKVINNLVLPAGETFTFDSEKIVLEAGDKIVALGESPTNLVATVSFLEV